MGMHKINLFLSCLLFLCLGVVCAEASQFFSALSNDKILDPSKLVNLAVYAQIETNATCGDKGSETFCRPSKHESMKLLCDECSNDDHRKISNVLDSSDRSWQSPTLAVGVRYNWVTITLDLRQIYQVHGIAIKLGNSPRPGNWILEKSIDGRNYLPWKYFVSSREECLSWFKVQSSFGANGENMAECSMSNFSRLESYEEDEIGISMSNRDPDVEISLSNVADLIKARYVRMRLQKIQTHLHGNVGHFDPLPLNSYYYSMREISILGSCVCYGRGSKCIVDHIRNILRCQCTENTCGDNCEKCCHSFHRIDSSRTNEFVCAECNCNGHSNSCELIESTSNQSEDAVITCLDCKHHTAGSKCEGCMDGFFRTTTNPNDPCIPCTCKCIGCSGLCMRNTLTYERDSDRQCFCKEGFSGVHCDRCSKGYHGYPECKQCLCSGGGSVESVSGITDGCCEIFRRGWLRLSGKLSSWIRTTPEVNNDCLYSSAPKTFLRDKVKLYGKVLKFIGYCDVNSMRSNVDGNDDEEEEEDDDDDHKFIPDLIIEGGGFTIGRKFSNSVNGLKKVTMVEHGWIILGRNNITCNCNVEEDYKQEFLTKDDFIKVLSDIKRMMMRTSCHHHHHHSVLEATSKTLEEQNDDTLYHHHHHRRCPAGYESCEECRDFTNERCKMCLPGYHGNLCRPSEENDGNEIPTLNAHHADRKCICVMGGVTSHEYSSIGCSQCSCLLSIINKSIDEKFLDFINIASSHRGSDDEDCCNNCSCHSLDVKEPNICIEDECAGRLLLNMQIILQIFECFNFTPWSRLNRLNYSVLSLQDDFKVIKFKEEFQHEFLIVDQLVHTTSKLAEDVVIIGDNANEKSNTLVDAINNRMTKLKGLREDVADAFSKLNHMSTHSSHYFMNNSARLHNASKILLKKIGFVNTSNSMHSARRELHAAKNLETKILNFIGAANSTNQSDLFNRLIRDFEEKLKDIKYFSDNASIVSMDTIEANEELKLLWDDLEKSVNDIQNMEEIIRTCGDDGYHVMLINTFQFLTDDDDDDDKYYKEMTKISSFLQNLEKRIEKRSKRGSGVELHLIKSGEKSKDIAMLTSALDKINLNFSLPLLSQKIEEHHTLKYKLSKLLREVLNRSSEALYVASQFNESFKIDPINYTSIYDTINRAEGIIHKYGNISSFVNAINQMSGDSLGNITETLDGIQNDMSASNISTILTEITSNVQSIPHSTERSKEIISSISNNVSHFLGSGSNLFEEFKVTDGTANEAVVSLGLKVDKYSNGASQFSERMDRLKKYEEEIKNEVTTLRHMMKYARASASNIRAPLCHKGGCVRSYRIAERTSLSNSIEFSFKTNSIDLNQMLVLINDGEDSKFMAVELLGRRIRFSWRFGDETCVVETMEEVVGDVTWYKVKAERIGHIGKLWVYDINGVELLRPVVKSFQPLNVVFHMTSAAELFIGGVTHDYQIPIDLSSRDFSGCLGNVILDGSPMGMFAFQKILSSTSQTCYGSPSSQLETEDRSTFHFHGSSHVIMKPIKDLSLQSIAISLTFKNYWKDSFLFGSVNNETGEFISLVMKDGRVVFSYGWPVHDFKVMLMTKYKYNTNQWVKVYARRTNLQGVLRVDKEQLQTPLHDDLSYDSLDLRRSPLYFGSIPNDDLMMGVANFLGCMRDITIDSGVVHVMDLYEGVYMGVKHDCTGSRMTSSGFMGSSSFLELEFHHGSPSPTFSFLFRAISPNALLILSANEDYQISFLVQLSIKCALEVMLRWDERLLRFKHNQYLCDDEIHFVSVYEDHERVKMMVDRAVVKETFVNDVDDYHVSSANVLFVGGVPPDVLEPNLEGTFQSLNGCISELIVNNILLSFGETKSFLDADVGRCQAHDTPTTLLDNRSSSSSSSSSPRLLPQSTNIFTSSATTEPHHLSSLTPSSTTYEQANNVLPLGSFRSQQCSFKKSYHFEPNAVSFGATRTSYVVIDLKEYTDPIGFVASFHMRTHSEEGVILYSSTRNSFAWSVSLMLGHIVVAWGLSGEETRKEVRKKCNDGHWVLFDVSLSNQIIKIVVDGVDETMFGIDSYVFEHLYIGRKSLESYNNDFEASAFRGCIANFSVNDELIHLANSQNTVGLMPCHSNLEKGAFFDGYAYAMFAEHIQFKSFLTISFNMKLYQPNGIVFVMSDFNTFVTLVIFLSDEQVIFKVSDYDSMYSVESEPCSDCLCDGSWHHVVAELFSDGIVLRIDGRINNGTKIGNSIDLNMRGKLYVGGNPAPIGPLMLPESGDFFNGCLANIRINNEPIDWWNAEELFGVHLSGCPIL